MENAHPKAEQLSFYMESPESSKHKDIRAHLMKCEKCRSRVDKLTQLELDIKHYAPRFRSLNNLKDDMEQVVERYMDKQPDTAQSGQIEQRIHNDPAALKAALHYAVHSTAMSKNIDTMNISLAVASPTATDIQPASEKSLLHRITHQLMQGLRWPTPAWILAPASLATALLLSYSTVTLLARDNQPLPHIAAFQDDATISFQKQGLPVGSIGFFHDTQSRSEPFSGIAISVPDGNTLNFGWQAIENATEYTVDIYTSKNGEKLMISRQTTQKPQLSFSNLNLVNKSHYQWQLSGSTRDGLKFTTRGDFIFYASGNS